MGRPTKAALVLGRAQARGEDAESVALSSVDSEALTARFLEVRSQAFRSSVDTAVELGKILLQGKKLLRGEFTQWISERLSVERTTAANYLALARLGTESPALIERFKDLGVSKLYKVARLAPADRVVVLKTPALGRLTDGEFHKLTRPYLKKSRAVTGNMIGHGLRMKALAVTTMLSKTKAPRIADPKLRAGLREQLLELAKAARVLAEQIK